MKRIIVGLSLLSAAGLADAQTMSTPSAASGAAPAEQTEAPTRATGTGPASASAQAQPGAQLQASDQKFFKKAAIAGLSEVAAGNTAAQQSSNPQVKAFAQQMVSDHGQINDQLRQLAQSKGVTLPAAPNAKHQQKLDALGQLQGAAFDKAYVGQQLKAHKKAVSLFKSAAKSQDPDIAAFAQKNLPTLQHHLKMVEQLNKGV